MSLFNNDALEKAKRVNEEVSQKMASLKDIHEEILRPKNNSRSTGRLSIRSQFSDSNYHCQTEDQVMLSQKPQEFPEDRDMSAERRASYLKSSGSKQAQPVTERLSRGGQEDAAEASINQYSASLAESDDNSSVVDQSQEIKKLKIQNGCLLLNKALHNYLKTDKQKFFARWKSRAHMLSRVRRALSALQDRRTHVNTQILKRHFGVWKAAGAMVITEMI